MQSLIRDQKGVAAVVEIVVAAAVIALMALVFYQIQAKKPATPNQTSSQPAKSDTTANGKVSTAVNSIIDDATAEAAASSKEDGDTKQVGASSSAASNLGGSYNENNF